MGTHVHPTAVLGPGVELGMDTVVGPYAVITGPCRIGDRTWIGAHAVIGSPPEIRGHDLGTPWGGKPVGLGVEVGDDTTVRELVTVHQGTHRVTRIANRCYVMNTSYVAHDSVIGDDVTLAAHVTLAGHVQVGPGANLGMACSVHQRRLIGPGAIVGMGAAVTRDVPPYAKAYGSPARIHGVNEIGMQRSGIDEDDITALAQRYAADPPGTQTGWTPPGSLRAAWEWWRARSGTG